MIPVPDEASGFAVKRRERQATDGGRSRGSRRKMEGALVLTSRDKGFVCTLPQIASSPQPEEVGTEGERERKAGGYYGGAEARPKYQGGDRKEHD